MSNNNLELIKKLFDPININFETLDELENIEIDRDLLLKDNIKASVVSLPCWEIFEKQSEEYKLNVLGEKLKVGVEAGSELGWHKYIGSNGIFIGMKTFGASAPANHLFNHFGLSSDKVRDKIISKINQ